MPDLDIIGENSGSLSLTAADIRSMTDWPDQLIIDYLNLVEMMNRITQAINNDFGTMALQNADAVAITGGTISGVTLDDIFIGDVTATNVTTVNLTATGTVNLHDVTITGYTHTAGLTDDATAVQVTITDSLVSINQDASIGQIWTAPYAIFDTSTVTNDGLILNSAFTGIADNTVGTIVARVRVKGSNNRTILMGKNVGAGTNTVYLYFSNTTNLLNISCRNGASNRVFGVSSVAYTDDTEWLSICISFNTASSDPQMYVNDVSVLDAAASGNTAGTIAYTGATKWTVGIDSTDSADFAGDMEFVWANFTSATDFSVEANRRLYFDAAGFTVDLGPTGNLPTGSTPMLYVVGAPPEFATNLGTGGGFTLQGSITGGIDSIGRLHFTDGGYYTDNATSGDMGAETFNSLGYYQNGVYVPTISSTSTLTNKSISLTTNTITGTMAEFNTALTDSNFGYTTLSLAQFAATTSLELKGVISDETGSGSLVFATSPGFTTSANPLTNDSAALGTTALGWSDLFLATGGTVHFANTDWVATHSTGILTVGTGDLRVTTAGVNAASVLTSAGAQDITGKTKIVVDNITIDLNTISSTTGALNLTPVAGSAIVLDGTINVDAGVVTGATSITSTQFLGALNGTVGAITPAAGVFTNLTVNDNTILGATSADTLTINAGAWTIGANYEATRAAGTVAAGVVNIIKNTTTLAGDSGGTSNIRTFYNDATTSGANNISVLVGTRLDANHNGSGTITTARAVFGLVQNLSNGVISTARGSEYAVVVAGTGNVTLAETYYSSGVTFVGAGLVTTSYGFHAASYAKAGITTGVGFIADEVSGSTTMIGFQSSLSSGTGKWNFYNSGTANNAFAGNVRIGSTTAPTVALDVTGAALISTTLGVTGILTLTPAISMLSTGGGATVGELTMVIGTKLVNTTAATSTCKIFFQRKTAGGTIGFATTYTINPGVSFTVSSDSALDTSTYAWWIVEAR